MTVIYNPFKDKQPSFDRQITSHITNGITTDVNNVQYPLNTGVSMPPMFMWNFLPPLFSAVSIAASQAITPNVPMTFNADSTKDATVTPNRLISSPFPARTFSVVNNGGINTLQYGATVPTSQLFLGIVNEQTTPDTMLIPGQTDCSIAITFSSASVTATSLTLIGYDYRGVAVSETITIQTNTYSQLTFYSNKAYAILVSATFTVNPAVNISLGWSSQFGFPYSLGKNRQSIIYASWGNTQFTTSQLQSNINNANNWRGSSPTSAPVLLSATPLNDSARGLITLPSFSDGATLLSVLFSCYGADSQLNANLANKNQSALLTVNVVTNTPVPPKTVGNKVFPYLLPQDLTGVQYPGDIEFINAYNIAKA